MARPIKHPGNADDARLMLWRVINSSYRRHERAVAEGDDEMQMRTFHAVSQGLGMYRGYLELTDMAERLVALEQGQGLRKVA